MRLKKQCHSVCFLFVSGIVTVALQRIDELAKLNATSRMVGISYPKYQFVADSSQEKQVAARQDDDELRLVHDLLAHYNTEVRPVKRKSQAVEVVFGVAYVQLVDLDEKNQVLVSSVWVRQAWYNYLLTWNASHYGGITSINVSPDKVWLPDIILYNSAEAGMTSGNLDQFETKVQLNSDGLNTWYAPTILRSRCNIDITYFPFDEQRCVFRFGSWTYDGLKVDLHNMSATVDLAAYMPSGEFQMIEAPVKRVVVTYSCCPEPYPNLLFTIRIKRKVFFYLCNLMAPCFLVTVLALLAFVVPPRMGKKISLIVKMFFAVTVFMLMIAGKIPRTSNKTPVLTWFVLVSLTELGLVLIATTFVLNLYFNIRQCSAVPQWAKVAFIDILGELLFVTRRQQKLKRNQLNKTSNVDTASSEMDVASAGTSRNTANNEVSTEEFVIDSIDGKTFSIPKDFISNVKNGKKVQFEGQQITEKQERLLKGITILRKRSKEKEMQEEFKEEWESLANVVDRMFLVIFIAIIATSIAMILHQLPYVAI